MPDPIRRSVAPIERAYSVLEIKGMNEEERSLSGIATTPSPDNYGDVVEPEGAEFKLPIPLLWQHDSSQPIGHVTKARVSKSGIEITAKLVKVADPGTLKDRLDEAWQSIKSGLVRGLSIGFRSIEHSYMKDSGGIHFQRWSWLELSAVTIPANSDASIQAIKSFDVKQRATTGDPLRHASSPGVPGIPNQPASSGLFHSRSTKVKTMKELLDDRATKMSRLDELSKSLEAGEDVSAEFDTLTGEVEVMDRQIRLARLNQVKAANASPAEGGSQEDGARSRGLTIFSKKADPDEKFKGQAYTRLLIAKAAAFCALKSGQFLSPAEVAEKRWGKTHPNTVAWIKTAVAGGGTGSGEWGAELAQSDTRYTGDFIEFLYSKTVFDRLPLREVPARVHVKGQDGAATGYWVGESKAIPVTKPDFSDVELLPLKVGAIATCSKELVADSTPSAEMLIRDAIAEASAQRIDTTFLSTAAASAGVSPAGLLNGLSAFTPSGQDAAAVRKDFQKLVAPFIAAHNAAGLVHVMTPTLALALGMLSTNLGIYEFPDIMESGGTLFKRPVYTGDNVAAGNWIVLKPSDIWKIGDGGLDVSMSDTATVEQNDAPAGAGDTPTAASATLINLWQEDMVGFKVVRRINYGKRRSSAVQYMSGADYGSPES